MRGMHWVNLRWSIKVCINVQYVLCKPQLVYKVVWLTGLTWDYIYVAR
jgi:hypothetical protein